MEGLYKEHLETVLATVQRVGLGMIAQNQLAHNHALKLKVKTNVKMVV